MKDVVVLSPHRAMRHSQSGCQNFYCVLIDKLQEMASRLFRRTILTLMANAQILQFSRLRRCEFVDVEKQY